MRPPRKNSSAHPRRRRSAARAGWRCPPGLGALLVLASLLTGCGPPLGVTESPIPGNLLTPMTEVTSYGVVREQRLTDGHRPAPGVPVEDYTAAFFLGPDARVTWDFGRPTRVDAVQLVSNDVGRGGLSWSLDGERFTPIRLSPPAGGSGMQTRHASELGLTVRCLRLRPSPDARGHAYAEFLAFAARPDAFPVSLAPRQPPTLAATITEITRRIRLIDWIKVGTGLAAIALVLLFRRASRRLRAGLALLLLAVGLAAFVRFGWFGGNGKILHPHDTLHYHLGAKYFDELGYRELYRALATHERVRGRGVMIDRELVRNLDDNRVHRGTWTATPDGTLRATFTPERREAFARDADAFRRLFVLKSFHHVPRDHGYNATPFHTAWLRTAAAATPVERGALYTWAGVDLAFLVIAVVVLLWAFGPAPAAIAALVLGLGEPWSFSWTGGSMARTLWVALLCGGFALCARRRPATGTVLLTAAGLLRLFPLVFVGALGLFALVRAVRDGAEARRTFLRVCVAALATTAAGIALVWFTLGPEVFEAFWANTRGHASLPPGNHLGLRALLAGDTPITASTTALPGWRLALWLAAVAAAFVVLVWRAFRSETLAEAVPWAAPLLFAGIPLSGYDYVWLFVLAPLATGAPVRCALLIGLAALTVVYGQTLDGLRAPYLATNVTLTVVLPLFFLARPRHVADRDVP